MNELVIPNEYLLEARLYILRAVVKFDLDFGKTESRSFYDKPREHILDDVFEFFDTKKSEFENEVEIKRYFKTYLEKLESVEIKKGGVLTRNISVLATLLDLNEAEKDALRFFAFIEAFMAFCSIFRHFSIFHYDTMTHLLAIILGHDKSVIKEILSKNSKLFRSKILKAGYSKNMDDYIELSDRIDDALFCEDVSAMFDEIFHKILPAKLDIDDFSHIKFQKELMSSYLKSGKSAINILIYGIPDVGKTEYTKAVTKFLGLELFEISHLTDSDRLGDDKPFARLSFLEIANSILKNSSILLFDEVEDLFSKSDLPKARINSILENNKIPTFWITNKIYEIDNAYIRRFGLVMEFKNPPKAKREEIFTKYAKDLVSEKLIKKLAKDKNTSPANVAIAANVVENLSSNRDENFNLYKLNP